MKKFIIFGLLTLTLFFVAGSYGHVVHAANDSAAAQPDTGIVMQEINSFLGVIMSILVGVFSWLMAVGALTLDTAVYYTVVHLGGGGPTPGLNNINAIGVAWRVLRDIGNVALIFGFLFIGVSTMLDVDTYGVSKRLPLLIVVAIFLNFSLFISEAIVDMSDVFATQIFTAIQGGKNASGTAIYNPVSDLQNVSQEGISSRMFSNLGLSTVFNIDGHPGLLGSNHPIYVGILAVILFTIAAFVFFSLAFILIARFVAIVFLVVVAPIGFVGLAVPKMEKYAKQWWEQLFTQSITAPVLLLLLYIAVAVVTDSHFLTAFGGADPGGFANIVDDRHVANLVGIILSFLIAMGLFLAVVIFSKKIGAFGAGLATEYAGKASFGVAGYIGRRTGGKFGGYLAKRIQTSRVGTPEFRRFASMPFAKLNEASFDVRGGAAWKATGVKAGDAQHGGYKHDEHESMEARKKYAATLKMSGADKDRIADAQKEIDAEQTKFNEDIAGLRKEEGALAEDQKNLTTLTRRLAEKQAEYDRAQTSGDLGAIVAASKALDVAKTQRATAAAITEPKLEELRRKIDERKASRDGIIDPRKKLIENINYNNPSLVYARSLQRSNLTGQGLSGTFNWVTSVGHANHEAYEAIVAESKKGPGMKFLESLVEGKVKESIPAASHGGGGKEEHKEEHGEEKTDAGHATH